MEQSDEQAANGTATTDVTDTQVRAALRDAERRERLIFGDEALYNLIIERYLDELSGAASVPVVRGYSALRPVHKPKTLWEAKQIVDEL